jgi:hypothetical protein
MPPIGPIAVLNRLVGGPNERRRAAYLGVVFGLALLLGVGLLRFG